MLVYLLRQPTGTITLAHTEEWDAYKASYKSDYSEKVVDISASMYTALNDNVQATSTQSYLRELWNAD